LNKQNQRVTAFAADDSGQDTACINFLCWNIKKGMKPNWKIDLQKLVNDKNMVIIQEAILHSDMAEVFDGSLYCSFAKGYKTKKRTTGLMTISKHKPIRRHHLTCWEPWLATPKCTHITEYLLSDTEETLVVVNIHAINFTLGVRQFRKQINKVCAELSKHNGPIILSGDFNTWRKKRMKILEKLAVKHGLDALSFNKDHRKSVFGLRVDHVYVRSLMIEHTKTYNVKSSDHNPISAELRY